MKYISSVISVCLLLILVILIASAALKCDHEEMGKIFTFQFEGSTAAGCVKPFCKNCNHYFGYSIFRGTPEDSSYLEVIEKHSGVSEIVGGEHYTMTAIVALADYDFGKTRIRCKVEKDDIIVEFSVEFREEFEESVALYDEGDEITFRGRLYDSGFGFTDCELIIE